MNRDHVFVALHCGSSWHSEEVWQASRTDPAQLAVQTQQLWDQSGFVAAQWAELVAMNAALQAADRDGVTKGGRTLPKTP